MPLHPSDRRLNRYADRELPPQRHARVSRHLENCARCRSTVMELRALVRDATELAPPRLPAALRDRVLASAAREAFTIIPVADPVPSGRRWPRLVWVAAGMAVVAIAIRMVLAPPELRSEASTLTFAPEHPAAGSRVEVTYRATPRLAGEQRLRLRARYRRPDDPQDGRGIPQVEVATLTHEGGGTFRGMLELPADVVYGLFAVEDEAADVVDGGGPLGWELLTYIGDRPSYEALEQRANEATRRDLRLALQAVTEATTLYAGQIHAWMKRSALELQALGTAAYDSLQTVHLARLRESHDSLRHAPLEPEVARSMYFYASTWGQSEIANWWYGRIVQDAPHSAPGVQLQTLAIELEEGDDPWRAVAALEALWADVGARHVALPQTAYGFARDAGDAGAMVRWASRWLMVEPWRRLVIIRDMVEIPALGDTALAWLAREAAALRTPDPARRALHRTAAAQRRLDERVRHELLGLMSRARLAAGDVASGLALADSATTGGWDLSLFRDLADARLKAGDVPGGIDMLARLAADPAYLGPDVTAEALRMVAPSEWQRAVERTTERMIAETLREAEPRAMPDSVGLIDTSGIERGIHDLTGDRVAVFAFFWPGCKSCVADLRRLQETTQELPEPASVLLVSTAPISDVDLALLRNEGIDLVVAVDASNDLSVALDVWGVPHYSILDRRGVVQFSHATLQDVPRQVLALTRAGAPVT